jgi:drug/metabolite transporter (DMT)-like permease
MTDRDGARRGILLMIGATAVFAAQDGLSKHLTEQYSAVLVTAIRYWFFAAFVIALAARRPGGLRAAARTRAPAVQAFRGVALALEVVVTITAFAMLGLIVTHAIFACYGLMVAALSGPLLGEKVGWRRWTAIGVGFLGVLVVLRPGAEAFDPNALVALAAAAMFALYQIATRHVGRIDSATTSFFYTGVVGAAVMTVIGPFWWEPMQGWDIAMMAVLCVTGATGHLMLIRALEATDTGVLQPFSYFQLVFVSGIGVVAFGERIDLWTALGSALIVGAGLFTAWREQQRRREGRPA